jgi:hypothetical protein
MNGHTHRQWVDDIALVRCQVRARVALPASQEKAETADHPAFERAFSTLPQYAPAGVKAQAFVRFLFRKASVHRQLSKRYQYITEKCGGVRLADPLGPPEAIFVLCQTALVKTMTYSEIVICIIISDIQSSEKY